MCEFPVGVGFEGLSSRNVVRVEVGEAELVGVGGEAAGGVAKLFDAVVGVGSGETRRYIASRHGAVRGG